MRQLRNASIVAIFHFRSLARLPDRAAHRSPPMAGRQSSARALERQDFGLLQLPFCSEQGQATPEVLCFTAL